ncbi:flavin monoamine oxidase family protein [Streptomyces sp. NPDC057743]|uniref:flavin monoamine oxidase family protein n=1 Tax=Streptomyces sp. NPDC057743 TaxID=3346236 RepID=UPI00368F639F
MTNSYDAYDVAVIGAGFAGVIAARDLSVEGHSVVHLEARDRIGGRTHTGEAFGRPLELGGAYVHWTQPHVWRELRCHRIGLVPPLATDTVHWLADGTVHTGNRLDYGSAVGPLMARCFADARERFPLPFDLAAADHTAIEKETLADRLDALDLSAYDRDVLDGSLAALVHDYRQHGVAQLLLGVATYFGDWSAFFETASHWPIEGGTRRLLDALAAESRAVLRLATPVTAIEDDGAGVTVTTRDGQRIRARSAVVAVPLNTLADLTLTPQLAQPVGEMIEQKLPMRTVKIWARVRGEIEPFYAFAPLGKNPINAARVEYRHQGDTLLMCLASDASAIRADDREAVQRALRTFVPDLDVLESTGHDWVNDPFSQGTWAMHRPGNLTGVLPRLREPHGRLHFAGSDIAAMEAGSIEGAMESGARAARDIAAALLNGSY